MSSFSYKGIDVIYDETTKFYSYKLGEKFYETTFREKIKNNIDDYFDSKPVGLTNKSISKFEEYNIDFYHRDIPVYYDPKSKFYYYQLGERFLETTYRDKINNNIDDYLEGRVIGHTNNLKNYSDKKALINEISRENSNQKNQTKNLKKNYFNLKKIYRTLASFFIISLFAYVILNIWSFDENPGFALVHFFYSYFSFWRFIFVMGAEAEGFLENSFILIIVLIWLGIHKLFFFFFFSKNDD